MNETPIADAILEMVKAEYRLKTSHSSGERAFSEMREARSAKQLVERLIAESFSEVKNERD